MRKRSGAGSLSERVVFMRQDAVSDGYGGTTTSYVDVFTDAARLQPRLGSESVQAARLAGTQPFSMVVRSSAQTRQVTPSWRARNARSGETYNIKAIANPDERNAYLELLVVSGEAG